MLRYAFMVLLFVIGLGHESHGDSGVDDEKRCGCTCEITRGGMLSAVESCFDRRCKMLLCRSGMSAGVTCCDADDGKYRYETEDAVATVTATPSGSATATVSVTATPSQEIGVIHYAADNTAELFINGISVHASFDWRTTSMVQVPLEIGDVIGIHAKDNGGGWHGVIVAVELKGVRYVSGKSDEWKAVKEFVISGDELLWTYKSFTGCEWPRATVLPQAEMDRRGKAEDFPYKQTGARYIWSQDAGKKDGVYLRIVIGGERCSV